MWSLLYGILFIFILWLIARTVIWQIARWIKKKFDVDVVVKYIGFFSMKEIIIRVNQLQTIEMEKITLHFKLLNRSKTRLISLEFGEIRVRSEINQSPTKGSPTPMSTPNQVLISNNNRKTQERLISFLQFFFKHMSLSVDRLNIMVLHAIVPNSLLHVNILGISLASEKVTASSAQFEMAPCLLLKSIEGKILKRPKETTEETSCIAEVSTSLEVVVEVKQLKPFVDISLINVDLNKLQVEIHEGALVPGILLPSIDLRKQTQKTRKIPSFLCMDHIQSHLTSIIAYLPNSSTLHIRTFGLAFFGDETMGETTRGAHVCCRKIILSQAKDDSMMVPVVVESMERQEFKVPHGYIRLIFEDVTMTDYYKHKVAFMGKTVLETKLTANGVLSNSLDLTAWHVDYIHKESVEFWSIIFKKLEDAKRHRTVLQEAQLYYPHQYGPSADGTGNSSRRFRVASAPDTIGHPDILQGIEDVTYPEAFDERSGSPITIAQVLKTIQINVIFECTIYDASLNAWMTPVGSSSDNCNLPSVTIGLDSFTGSVDQSPNSRDFNFMSKMEHLWCMCRLHGLPIATLTNLLTGLWMSANCDYMEDFFRVRINLKGEVSRKNDASFNQASELSEPPSPIKCDHDLHLWGRVFNVECLGLYGSACIKSPCEPDQVQEISFLVDAKVSGVQVELSGCAAEALASFLATVIPDSTGDSSSSRTRPVFVRRMTSIGSSSLSDHHRANRLLSTYHWTLACLEIELTRFNGFILSAEETSFVDCVVARFDKVKVEIAGSDDATNDDDDECVTRSVSVLGFAVTTIHNRAFTPFASYDAGLNGSRTPASQLPPSMRDQHVKSARYRCVQASEMNPNHASFDSLEIAYSTNFDSSDSDSDLPRSPKDRLRRQLVVNLTSESVISIRWSPTLHALIHYGLVDFTSQLAPFFKSTNQEQSRPNESRPMYNSPKTTDSVSNHGDHQSSSRSSRNPITVRMFGDGGTAPVDSTLRPIDVTVNLSPLKIHFCLSDVQSLSLSFSPIRCMLSNHQTVVTFDELAVIMDDKKIFTFLDTIVEMATSSEICTQDRKMFSCLKTAKNRAWSFQFSSVKCNFPHKYNFASTFDLFVTTFKWVKGLYRKTSHPFRSSRLPPDLFISIDHFVFEIEDWGFECHLRDNHELMKDEWTESEKRRHVLDQRMANLRKERGEMLPAKKVEELYCRLEEECTKIYLARCRDLYGFCSQPVFTMPHHELPQFESDRRSPTNEPSGCPHHLGGQCRPDTLLSWTLINFTATVLADESMHGMKKAIDTIKNIDPESPFPFSDQQDEDPEFVTLWCRVISLHASNHQVRLRNYPQCLMDYSDWTIRGRLCGAEQKGSAVAKRTEYVHLPAPWGRVKVLRNMPALKFYHDLTSEVHTFNMAWGPCWDPAWSQVNLALNLITKTTIDPSPLLPWWDKSRMLFHGKLEMSMGRANLLHLASLDPYNTTEHMHWDWKNLYMLWISGHFLFKGDLDIHIRNASKYDDIRFLHLPHLKMACYFQWICLDDANPHDHHQATPCAPDKIEAGELADHDSYRHFRSRNIDLSIDLDTRCHTVEGEQSGSEERDKPEILLYSTTMRWLSHFWFAINAVARPICRGPLFNNVVPPKLKLSRHYRNVKLSFQFPELKACYWASYAQQLGIEWLCGAGTFASHFRLHIIPHDGKLVRRSASEWSVHSITCDLSNTKIYLLKRRDVENIPSQSPSMRSLGAERNFMLSLSQMCYHRSVSDTDGQSSPVKTATMKRSGSTLSRTSVYDYDDGIRRRRSKKVASPTKKPQNRQTLIVHDLRAMWTTDNRDVVYGLYEGYNKAAVLRRNLSTKIMSKFRIDASRGSGESDAPQSRSHEASSPSSEASLNVNQRTMDPSEMLQRLLSESGNKMVVGAEEPSSEKPSLKGVAASRTDDVINQNWLIKFFNCQAMLKGPKTQGYIILTAAQADFLNRDYKVTWRAGQLTTKSSWVGSLNGTQVFATVERNVTSSGQDGENVPWLSVSDIAPRGPSPGMLDISDLMGGGQAVGGVVGDGVSAGSFQLQRIVSRCTCQMFYVGYESLVDSEQSDYARLLPETPLSPEEKVPDGRGGAGGNGLLKDEKPSNLLTILQPELEICTNASQFTMILDIVENLLLYVEPVMKEHWEKVESMRFKLSLTSADDALKHRDTLAAMQSRIRTQLTNMRQLERQLYRTDRALDNDPANEDLLEECTELRQRLADDKETLNLHSEELGIVIRCFKELFLEQKTRNSSLRQKSRYGEEQEEDEALVARTTEVSLGRVKWNLTDDDGQLNLAQFEMKDFLYEKVNRSDDSVSHCFEIAWLSVQNLLPNSIYRDVIKPRHPAGLRNYGVSGAGGQSLSLRVLCRVRPPVGGISVKDHVEVNAAPFSIQLTYHFFKKMMGFFFPGKETTSSVDDHDVILGANSPSKENKGATLLGMQSSHTPAQEHRASILSLPARPPPPSPSSLSATGTHRRNRSSAKRDRAIADAVDDVDKMKQRAAKNNSFLYIKITQVPLCVSYKGEKEKNMADVHEFDVTIPMLEYHSMTWTWHDLAMAVKRDCKKQLVSQLFKKKFHLVERAHSQSTRGSNEQGESPETVESNKVKLLLGNTLQRSESTKRSFLSRKKK